jgi:hypothetical protein
MDVISAVLVLVWIAAFVLVAVGTAAYLRRAHESCSDERDRLLAERRAFERFVREVEAIDPPDAAVSQQVGGTASLSQSFDTDTLDEVADAYRDTVMNVAHYESDYGEPLAENMAQELGPEVATAIVDGTRFTPQVKVATIQKCTEAYERRDSVLRDIDAEESELEDATERVTTVRDTLERLDERSLLDKDFDELREDYRTLCALETECETLLADRQDTVGERDPSPDPDEGHDFHGYLYGSLGVTYPVLVESLNALSTVRSARRRVLDSLTRRV